jgi:ABC-type lipoprotein release transport system permease subunit
MLTLRSIPFRNLLYHWRGNLAVLLGVAVGAAVLTGALFVGDSLRGSLRDRALRQLNGVEASWVGPRLIREEVAARLPGEVVPALMLQGTLATGSSDSRVIRATVIGLPPSAAERFGPAAYAQPRFAVLSAPTARSLGVNKGDTIDLSVPRFSNVPRSSLLGRRNSDDVTATLRLKVQAVLDPGFAANDFALTANPNPPTNVFVSLPFLQERLQQRGKVNALLAFDSDATALDAALPAALTPADAGLRVEVPKSRHAYVSVEAEQLVLDPAAVEAVGAAARDLGLRAEPTVAYLANWIAAGGKRIPYSVVAGLNPNAAAPLGPFLPPGVTAVRDDEIVLADWDDSPLKDVPAGSPVTLTFFKPELEAGAEEMTARFHLAGHVPLDGASFPTAEMNVAADPDLTPPFPGITDKLAISEWNPPFPFEKSRIRPGDENERYWNRHRTTPKAYITLAAAEKLFGSRFGVITSVRVAPPDTETPQQTADRLLPAIQKHLSPAKLGIVFDPSRQRLLEASGGSNDFAGLFLGFSLFLIVSALLLVVLLFRLNVGRRAKEIGFLLAAGYSPGRVRWLLLAEAGLVAVAGSLVGLAIAVAYSRLLLDLLVWLWPDRDVRTYLVPHMAPLSFAVGFAGTLLMAGLAIVFALRGLVRISPQALLRGVVETPEPMAAVGRPGLLAAALATALAVLGFVALGLGMGQKNPDLRAMSFFGGGGLLLAAGVLRFRNYFLRGTHGFPSARGVRGLLVLGGRNAGRFRGRSLLTVTLLATASFLLVAVESFRRTPGREFAAKSGGSGGFNLLAEVDVPVFQPFDREPGRGDLLDRLQAAYQKERIIGAELTVKLKEAEAVLATIRAALPLRLRGGDDASCLNLYQAGRPRVIGVPDALIERGGFQFAETEAGTADEKENPWKLLVAPRPDGAISVLVEQNTAMWMLKKGVGDEIDLTDDNGVSVRGRIVGTLQDSVFQSEILISDAAYRRLYPRDEGFRLFLIETDPADESAVSRVLETGLRSNGLIATPTRERVAGYQAVVGTYLTTFQLLGGLGLLLGILGVAVVIVRGIWERAAELALLRAFGYTTRAVRVLLLGENLLLLLVGLGLGTAVALISVAPHVVLGGSVPWAGIAGLAGSVLAVGVAVVMLTTAGSARVPVVPALRAE